MVAATHAQDNDNPENNGPIKSFPIVTDPFYPERDYSSAGCFAAMELEGARTAANVTFSSRFIKNDYEYHRLRQSSESISGEVSYGGVSGSASYSKASRKVESLTSKDVVWEVKAKRVYSPTRLTSVDLTRSGDDTLKQAKSLGNYEYFFQNCGRKYMTAYQKEASVSLIYIFNSKTTEKASRIRQEIGASISSSFGSAKANRVTLNKLREIDSNLNVEVYARQVGVIDAGQAIDSLAGVDLNDIGKVREVLGNALASVNYDAAVATPLSENPVSLLLAEPIDDRLVFFDAIRPRIKQYNNLIAKVQSELLLADRVENSVYETLDPDSNLDISNMEAY